MPNDKELVPDAILNRGGVKVSKSPWGPRDEIGRLNWITRDTNRAILEHLDGSHVFDLNVEFFIGMPSWVAAGDPPYGIWMTHTPQGSINDNLSGVGSAVHKKYSYCGDSIHLYTHCGTHIDTLNHLGFYSKFWNGWTADKELGSRIWNKGGPENYPPVIARAVMLDVAAMKGVDCLPDGYAVTVRDLQSTAKRQKVELRKKDVVLDPHRPDDPSGPTSTATSTTRPGSGSRRRSGSARRRARCASAPTRSRSRCCRPRRRTSSSRCTPTCSRPPERRSSRS